MQYFNVKRLEACGVGLLSMQSRHHTEVRFCEVNVSYELLNGEFWVFDKIEIDCETQVYSVHEKFTTYLDCRDFIRDFYTRIYVGYGDTKEVVSAIKEASLILAWFAEVLDILGSMNDGEPYDD